LLGLFISLSNAVQNFKLLLCPYDKQAARFVGTNRMISSTTFRNLFSSQKTAKHGLNGVNS
jgi:hypothetical protein